MVNARTLFALMGALACSAVEVARAQTDLSTIVATGVVSAGDVDGDGFSDILAAGTSGGVEVISGQSMTPIYSLVDPTTGTFGQAIDAGKDVDGDGFPDLVIGAPGDLNASFGRIGTVHLYSGRTGTLLASADGATGSGTGNPVMVEYFGHRVSLIGDTDSDGLSEIAVAALGSYTGGTSKGEVAVFKYSAGSLTRVMTRVGAAANDSYGWQICGVDYGHDGVADLAVSIIGYDAPRGGGLFWTNAGKVDIIDMSGTVLWTRVGAQVSELLGESLVNGGDTLFLGYDSILIGEPRYDSPTTDVGRVLVFNSASSGIVQTIVGTTAGQGLGAELAAAGDWDLDGRRDIISRDWSDVAQVLSENTGSVLYQRALQHVTDVPSIAGDLDVNGDGATDVVFVGDPPNYNDAVAISSATCTTCFPPGVTYCFGFTTSACPCSNFSPIGSGQGCLDSFGTGATLTGSGVASIGSDTLVLTIALAPSTASVIFFQGATDHNPGVAMDDGLLCVGGSITRLGTKTASGGVASYPGIGDTLLSANASSGATIYYQVSYRNIASFCTSATTNFTNGYRVVWAP